MAHKVYVAGIWNVAVAAYGETVRRSLYHVLLLGFATAILLSRFLTLFSFYQEMNMVREMGMATLAFWAFLVVVLSADLVVGKELEDRTAVTLLSKPLHRHDFLLGKFAGIVLALVPGMIVLAGVLFITLWIMAAPGLPLDDGVVTRSAEGPFATAWRAIWEGFVAPQGAVLLGGALLSLLQAAMLAALAVSFSAFLPSVVAVASTTLVFVLGNLSDYMAGGLDRSGSGALTAVGRVASHVLPNFGYFNLQTHFSEGRIVSIKYLGLAFAYAGLYAGAVFLVSCSLFRKREVR